MEEMTYRELKLEELGSTLLSRFNRFQETRRVWYIEDGQWKQKDDHFVERWDEAKKQWVLQDLRRCVQNGGVVVGAFLDETMVGFANVEGALFGSQKEYLELPYIHVTHECRGKRIGRELFALCCEKATKLGAKKLYIAAHPSIETQQFYRSVGCTLAQEINPAIYEREPLDIQLERLL
ncbi:GNAT family N-acetyltransferase [Brevibacillus choshinensis]|uniref:GNAT family N-acetyltransferase n=1 Tax=Brevibacillus choshinensis TaxID=54911 RepID=A0ABX7FMP7_BRECH|nr:GNAT family N-acetyltransferase [Brevibacillus choshinensis]QRG66561.1 GNAT family N-acetyltransferase [Brevibacillus choshinensis]